MKHLIFTQPLGSLARRSALLASLVTAMAITACGGGGGSSDSAAAPATGSNPNTPAATAAADDALSNGAITGFGSVIVNGVRFDDSSARVSDDDDDDNPGRSKDDLRLGMIVTVTGTSGTGTGSVTATGTATAIVFGSELQGPVQSINGITASGTVTTTATGTTTGTATGTTTAAVGTQTLTILGQTVVAGTRTIYDPTDLPNGFASIRIGNVLEVHGFLDPATNKLMATRIERKNNANSYKITGNVSSLKAASKTFKIGSETISYDGINPNRLRANLADGVTVRVRLSTTQTTTGTWNATRIKAANQVMENRNKVEIEGLITAFTSATKFSVRGVPVDASAASFPKGTTTVVLGARVEVKGALVNGVLIASRVKVESEDEGNNGNGNGNGDDNNVSSRNEIELHGAISSVNAASKTFALRGLTVSYAGTVDFQRGTATNLVNGAQVEVKGVAAATGTTVVAKKIKFEN
jgi:Domain of unknown function (DUF5666)